MQTAQLISTIRCPHCGFEKTETMPTDTCVYFYDCTGCGHRLSPKPGDCCVFCSYGTVKCPSKQVNCECSHEQ
jgi:hypothetical protein